MEKHEILTVLRVMKADFDQVPVKEYCNVGFCRWLFYCSELTKSEDEIILNELKKEGLSNYPSHAYWYPAYLATDSIINSIQPRIDHLNRTIFRLENEIKNEKL